MSVEEACERLGLSTTDKTIWQDQSAVRRAYFKLAQKYHPDKNSEGREQFEQINYAYEFLSSTLVRAAGSSTEPDINRIIVCLQAQCIVYKRNLTGTKLIFSNKNLFFFKLPELSPYKYSGYTQLIKTIDLESGDSTLFSNKPEAGKLLSVAVELCYYTLKSSALNAEQLRRDGGLDVGFYPFSLLLFRIYSFAS
jgi:DnaJ family protein C protein 13